MGNARGGQTGNGNSIRHGLRASKLPKGCKYLEVRLSEFRGYLLAELDERHGPGQVPIYHQAVVQSAWRQEMRALLAARWLSKGGEALPLTERLALLQEIGRATDARDRCLKEIGLHAGPAAADPFSFPSFLPPADQPPPPPPAPASDDGDDGDDGDGGATTEIILEGSSENGRHEKTELDRPFEPGSPATP